MPAERNLFPANSLQTAVVSDCQQYRYSLGRRWSDGTTCLFVMLNPSTADATVDDPTIRRCIGFARREGCGALEVVNLYALRATDPKELQRHAAPRGPQSDQYVARAIAHCDGPIICAWGADPAARSVQGDMIGLIQRAGRIPMCLGTTKAGMPRHPLYLPKDAPLEVLLPAEPEQKG